MHQIKQIYLQALEKQVPPLKHKQFALELIKVGEDSELLEYTLHLGLNVA